jgi:hypothetical protein
MLNIINHNQTTPNEFLLGDTLIRVNVFPFTLHNKFYPKCTLENLGLLIYVFASDPREISICKKFKELYKQPYIQGTSTCVIALLYCCILLFVIHNCFLSFLYCLYLVFLSCFDIIVDLASSRKLNAEDKSSSNAKSGTPSGPLPQASAFGSGAGGHSPSVSSASVGGSSLEAPSTAMGGGGGGMWNTRAEAAKNKGQLAFDKTHSMPERHSQFKEMLMGLIRKDADFARKFTFEASYYRKFWYGVGVFFFLPNLLVLSLLLLF